MVRLFLVLAVLAFPWLSGAGGAHEGPARAGVVWAQEEVASDEQRPLEQGRTASLSNLGPAEDGTVSRAENSVLGWIERWPGLPTRGAAIDERRAEAESWGLRLAPEWCERARGPPRTAARAEPCVENSVAELVR